MTTTKLIDSEVDVKSSEVPVSPTRVDRQAPRSGRATIFCPLHIWRGGRKETLYAPICGRCGEPIIDLGNANVSTDGWGYSTSTPRSLPHLKEEAGADRVLALPVNAFVLHKECDFGRNELWLPAHQVIQFDQRWPWDRDADVDSSDEPGQPTPAREATT